MEENIETELSLYVLHWNRQQKRFPGSIKEITGHTFAIRNAAFDKYTEHFMLLAFWVFLQ